MATVKWGALVSRGSVLTTEMNALANAGFAALGPVYDNRSNLDRWGWVELTLASLTPVAGACVYVFMSPTLDDTDYDDGPSSTNPASHLLVAVLAIKTGVGAKKVVSLAPFALPPGQVKFSVKNQAGVALGATGNVLALFTANESVA